MATKNASKFQIETIAQPQGDVEINDISTGLRIEDDGSCWVKVGNILNEGVEQKPFTAGNRTIRQNLLGKFRCGSFKVNGKMFGIWKSAFAQEITLVESK